MTELQNVPKTVNSIELRDYQKLAVQHILQRIEQACLQMYVTLPTGTGKAVILSAVAAQRLAAGRVLILIHRQDIAIQLVKTLKQTNLDVGLNMQGHRELATPVIVTMTQSLTKSTLHELLHTSELPIATILIDEAHHAIKGSAYDQIIQAVENASHPLPLPVIGFTATPYRSDKTSMFSLLPTCAFARDIPDMVRDHWLAPVVWEPIRVNVDLAGLATTDRSGEVDFAEGVWN